MIRHLIFATRPARYWLNRVTYHKSADHAPLRQLKASQHGRPMLIVGNGPSLNQTPLDAFQDVFAIGMNKINMLFPRVAWRPDLIVCTNNLVIGQNREFFCQTDIPVFVSWKGRRRIEREHRSRVGYFLNLPTMAFATDPLQGLGTAGTVTYTALQFAYWMGADPVILFGVDHAFEFAGKANEVVKRQGPDVNHFDPNYFAPGVRWGLPNLEKSEMGYTLARQAFEADGRRVYDATIGGKLEIFPRISVIQAKRLCGVTAAA